MTQKFMVRIAALVLLFGPVQQAGAAQVSASPAPPVQEEEILVVARRIGVPMWHVATENGTLILVGDIRQIVRNTRWNPAALDEALRRSDRVMFPELRGASGSLFGMLGLIGRWRQHATLPEGRSLSELLTSADWARLQRLRQAGLVEEGFERRHPFHLAAELRRRVGRALDYAPSVRTHVTRSVRRHRLNLVPIQRVRLQTVARDFFETPAAASVPCLVDAIALAEAGPPAIERRSQDWVQRRVPEVVESPAERVVHSCQFLGLANDEEEEEGQDDLWTALQQLVAQPGVTVAVMSLTTLASEGGILDRLRNAGHSVAGPAWRRSN